MTLYTQVKFLKSVFSGKYKWILALLGTEVIAGIVPISVSYIVSQIIDTISRSQNSLGIINYIVFLVLLYALFLFLEETFSMIHVFLADYLGDFAQQKSKSLVFEKISLYPTEALFESPEHNNLISLCKKNLEKVNSYINVVSFFIKGLFSLIPALIAVFFIEWWIPFTITLTFVPSCCAKIHFQKRIWNSKSRFSYLYNLMNLNERCLSLKDYSKELKLFNMQNHILTYWNNSFLKIFNIINKDRRIGICVSAILAVVSAIGMLCCFYYVTYNTVTGKISIGELTFLFSIILQLKSALSTFIYGMGEIWEAKLAIKPLIQLLNIDLPKIKKIENFQKSDDLLSLQNCSFHYPSNEKLIIDGVSFNIRKGEKIALVGENGSGKTTLVKLICRLYELSCGKGFWEGQDLDSIEFDDYRSQISVLFQDFAKFPITLRDNIDIRKQGVSDDIILNTLLNNGLNLSDKLDCYLSTSIADGLELSGGQWQKIAITRILLDIKQNKNLKLIIFDEPTSALDPNSEKAMMDQILSVPKDKSLLVISHKLALTRFVDRIVVMNKGKVIEEGSHNDLMNLKGAYYTMYKKQVSYYENS